MQDSLGELSLCTDTHSYPRVLQKILTRPDGRAGDRVGLRDGVPDADEDTRVVRAVCAGKRDTRRVGRTTTGDVDGVARDIELSTAHLT